MQAQERVRHWGFAAEFDRRSSPHYVLGSFKAAAANGELQRPWVSEAASHAIARAGPGMNPSQVAEFVQLAAEAGWKPTGLARAKVREAVVRCWPYMTAEQQAATLKSAVALGYRFPANSKMFHAAEKATVATTGK